MVFSARERRRRRAADWLARLQSGRDPDTEHKFRQWYEADIRNAAAFDRVKQTYDQAALLRMSVFLNENPKVTNPSRNSHYALAAALACALLIPSALIVRNWLMKSSEQMLLLATGPREVRQVELKDGSKVTLETATAVDISITRLRRSAVLKRGSARLAIAAGEVPFEMRAGTKRVIAEQGLFEVSLAGNEGRVERIAAAEMTRFPPEGRRGDDGQAQAPNADVAQGLLPPDQAIVGAELTRRMLQFEATPLTVAVADANRHSSRHILLTAGIGDLRVTGAFRVGDTLGLAKSLAAAFDLQVRYSPNGDIVLAPRPTPRSQKKSGG